MCKDCLISSSFVLGKICFWYKDNCPIPFKCVVRRQPNRLLHPQSYSEDEPPLVYWKLCPFQASLLVLLTNLAQEFCPSCQSSICIATAKTILSVPSALLFQTSCVCIMVNVLFYNKKKFFYFGLNRDFNKGFLLV